MPSWLIPDPMGCQVEVAERLSVSCSNDTSINHFNARGLVDISQTHRQFQQGHFFHRQQCLTVLSTHMGQSDKSSTNLSVTPPAARPCAMTVVESTTACLPKKLRCGNESQIKSSLNHHHREPFPPSLRIISHHNFSLSFPPTAQRPVPVPAVRTRGSLTNRLFSDSFPTSTRFAMHLPRSSGVPQKRGATVGVLLCKSILSVPGSICHCFGRCSSY